MTSLREARKQHEHNKLFTAEAKCMIGLTDGKFVTVVESCRVVRDMIQPRIGGAEMITRPSGRVRSRRSSRSVSRWRVYGRPCVRLRPKRIFW
jgi:hypothetical protein